MNKRFGTLDALRGLAAIAVVVFHAAEVRLIGAIVPHAYLAVDFFFVLSGFVISHTYEAKLAAGSSLRAFLARRIIRLYPMAALAVLLGGAVAVLKSAIDPARADPLARVVLALFANLALLPSVFGGPVSLGVLFPGNGPLWSICLEVLVNVVWCVALVRAATRRLACIVALCFALVVVAVVANETANLGFDWGTLGGGLARVGYGFGLGVLAHRFEPRLHVARSTALSLAGGLLLLVVFTVPAHGPGFEIGYAIVCIGFVLPLVVVLGLNGSDHPRIDGPLGGMSYPLYAVHFPILALASGLHQTRPAFPMAPLLLGAAATLAAVTAFAMGYYDRPVRGWLTKRHRQWGVQRQAPMPRPSSVA